MPRRPIHSVPWRIQTRPCSGGAETQGATESCGVCVAQEDSVESKNQASNALVLALPHLAVCQEQIAVLICAWLVN